MTSLDNKTQHARAMFRAGNYKRVKEICREVLEKDDTNLEAFEVMFETHMAQGNMVKALSTCRWRLERVPECVDAHMLMLLPLGRMKRKKEAQALIKSVRARFSDRPFHLEQSEILFSHFFKNSGDTFWRIKKAREGGNISDGWLDEIEGYERAKKGHIFSSQKLIAEQLKRNPQNYDALYSLSVTRFLVGRLFSAIRLARQAKRLKPERAAECNEVILASYAGLFPPLWGAQFFIVWVATITTRIFWLLRGPFVICGFILAFIIQGLVFWPLGLLMGGTAENIHSEFTSNIVGAFALLQFLWIIYLLFGFQKIGPSLSDKKKNVKLSKKY